MKAMTVYDDLKIGVLVATKPESAKVRILSVLRKNGANAVLAARAEGVTRRQWTRWIVTLGLEGETERMRREARADGWWEPTPKE